MNRRMNGLGRWIDKKSVCEESKLEIGSDKVVCCKSRQPEIFAEKACLELLFGWL